MPKLVKELDDACTPLLDAARSAGVRVWIVSEYGHVQVSRPVYPNRVLREAKLIDARGWLPDDAFTDGHHPLRRGAAAFSTLLTQRVALTGV